MAKQMVNSEHCCGTKWLGGLGGLANCAPRPPNRERPFPPFTVALVRWSESLFLLSHTCTRTPFELIADAMRKHFNPF